MSEGNKKSWDQISVIVYASGERESIKYLRSFQSLSWASEIPALSPLILKHLSNILWLFKSYSFLDVILRIRRSNG